MFSLIPYPPPSPPVAPPAAGTLTCPPGEEEQGTSSTGAPNCVPCPAGSYCVGGLAIECPAGYWQHGSLDPANPPQSNLSSCVRCPRHDTSTSCTRGRLEVLYGHWMNSVNSTTAYRCPAAAACRGGETAFGDTSCEVGHEGIVCGRCSQGFYRGRRACLTCANYGNTTLLTPAETTGTITPLLLLIALCVALYLEPPLRLSACLLRCLGGNVSNGGRTSFAPEKPTFTATWRAALLRKLPAMLSMSSGLCKILLAYSQCLSAINRFPEVAWPKTFISFMETLDEVNIEIFSVIPAECLANGRLGFYWELMAVLMMPLAMVGGAFMLVFLMRWAAGCVPAVSLRSRSRCCQFGWTLDDNTPNWEGLVASWGHPRMFKLLTWAFLIVYPPISRKCLAIFDCIDAGNDEIGTIRLLRDDPVFPDGWCSFDNPKYALFASIACLGIVVYCLGLPLLAYYLAYRFHTMTTKNTKDLRRERERVSLLIITYDDRFWYAESVALVHRFLFTGVIHVMFPGTRMQIWCGTVLALLCTFVFNKPYRYDLCNAVQSAALLQLLFVYICAFVFFDDGGALPDDNGVIGGLMVIIGSGCFLLMFAGTAVGIYRARRSISQHRLRYEETEIPVRARSLLNAKTQEQLRYHLFISHAWSTGQDAARIVKQRLCELMPELSIFLDVDDLESVEALEEYVKATDAVLVLATQGYFQSFNCMRELQAAHDAGKQIITVLEPDVNKGGLTIKQVLSQLSAHSDVRLTSELLGRAFGGTSATHAVCQVASWYVEAGMLVNRGDKLCVLNWSATNQPPFERIQVPPCHRD
jgi:hypothetical protein